MVLLEVGSDSCRSCQSLVGYAGGGESQGSDWVGGVGCMGGERDWGVGGRMGAGIVS
jgi:hypothetical protein